MDIAEDIRRIALQEERLRFDGFGPREAWEVGLALKAAGEAGRLPIVVDIRLATLKLLAFALPGGGPDNFDWARRKRNVVFRFHRSSYAVGRRLVLEGKTLADLGALPERDYVAHGGSVPILLSGTGCSAPSRFPACLSATITESWSRRWRRFLGATSATSRSTHFDDPSRGQRIGAARAGTRLA
jgi:uncharacterized protein (UPF0303 family)